MRSPADTLLLNLLNQQTDTGDGLGLSEARIEQALTVGPGFSRRESQLLWKAPFARDNLRRVRDRLRQETIARWKTSGVNPIAEFKAAADGADEVIRIRGQGFSLTIFPDADQTMPWILSLQIDAGLRSDMPVGLRFQLKDSGGMVWLKGRPNSRGEINEGWFDTRTSPRERLLAHHLQLTPI
jgi:hypothetical protein